MSTRRYVLAACIAVWPVLAGCSTPSADVGTEVKSVPGNGFTRSTDLPRIVIPDTPTVEGPAPAAQAYMPPVVCMNLQPAQNALQAAGVSYSRSADASGQGRMQVGDSNWIVVEQHPAPGGLVGEGDAVLSVVKIGEPNSC
ncbi:hypothetical protein ACIGGF_13955 [Rhodococcus sp. NPDC078407]|uniref:hypothetical protein n=1 Tax=Rhodococcus sp. NPDC078407 TaxID=3364509 RepID=UPI0037CAEFF5